MPMLTVMFFDSLTGQPAVSHRPTHLARKKAGSGLGFLRTLIKR